MSFTLPDPPKSVQTRNPELYDWMQKVKGKLEQSHVLGAGVALSQPTMGDMLYKAPLAWARLNAGVAGQILTQGTSTAPVWGNISSNIAAGTGIAISGTGTGTIALAPIADSRLLSNISGGTAPPSANSLSANMDYALGSTAGIFPYRGTAAWGTRTFNSAIPCTGTNNDAAAGELGEYISSSVAVGSAVTMGSGATTPITSVVLTPGDWDIEGHVQTVVNGSTVLTLLVGSISGTSTSISLADQGGINIWRGSLTGLNIALPTGARRYPLTGTSTVFLTSIASFATSTCSVYGSIRARRPR